MFHARAIVITIQNQWLYFHWQANERRRRTYFMAGALHGNTVYRLVSMGQMIGLMSVPLDEFQVVTAITYSLLDHGVCVCVSCDFIAVVARTIG